MHPAAEHNAGYFLFLEPAPSMVAGLGFASALATPARTWVSALAVVLLFVAMVDRSVQYVCLFRDDWIYGVTGRSRPETADILISFLDQQGIDNVMTDDWDLRWRMAFKTGERIEPAHLSGHWLRRVLSRRTLTFSLEAPRRGSCRPCETIVPPSRPARHGRTKPK